MRNSNKTQYKYDPVDNILGISNVITPKAPKKPKGFGGFGRTDGMGGPDAGKGKEEKPLGGAFSHTYAYDELNRLVKASGKAKGIGYGMDMSFGLMGEPLTKVQRTDSGSVAGSYALAYEYGDADHPTAPSQIGHERYTYDANGNPTLVEDDSLNTERRMSWDEENRLTALSDNGKTSRYTYNAAGERIVKSHGYLEGVYINGAPQGLTFHETEDYTIYPAPILSVTRQRFTKHYFIGDRRVASKIGAGIFQNAYGHGANVVTAGQKDYQMRMMQIERQREDYYRKLGTPPGVPTMKGATSEPENTHEGYNTIIRELGDHSVPDGWRYNVPSATPYPARPLVRPCSGTRPKTPTTCSRVTATCPPTPHARTSSTITPTTSAPPPTSPTPRPTSPSSTPTCPTANCSWTNIPPRRRCRISSTAKSSTKRQGCTTTARDT